MKFKLSPVQTCATIIYVWYMVSDRGFWRGNVSALLNVMPYTAKQFTVIHYLKKLASGSSKSENHVRLNPYLSCFSGALAGCAANVGLYPFDLLRTVLASQGELKAEPSPTTGTYFLSKHSQGSGEAAAVSLVRNCSTVAASEQTICNTFEFQLSNGNGAAAGPNVSLSSSGFKLQHVEPLETLH